MLYAYLYEYTYITCGLGAVGTERNIIIKSYRSEISAIRRALI